MLINSAVQAQVSMGRVVRFLMLEEINPDNVERLNPPLPGSATSDHPPAIEITSGIFAWEMTGFTTNPILSSINLKVPVLALHRVFNTWHVNAAAFVDLVDF